MGRKSAARLAYYEGLRKARLEHFEVTEQGLRKLKDVKPSHIEKLVADIQKQHRKLLNRIDRQIHDEEAAGKGAKQGKPK